jgi:Flp pilus assembly protein TadG
MVCRRPKTRTHAFRTDEQGSTALEFAFVAPLLFVALMSLIEIGVLGMTVASVDAAVVDAARRIRTGRDDAAVNAQAFEDQICAKIGGNLDQCRDRTTTSVKRYTKFADANAVATAPPDGTFDKGGPGDIVIVKVNYRWPLLTPYLGEGVQQAGPAEVTIPARSAFKNEPYG